MSYDPEAQRIKPTTEIDWLFAVGAGTFLLFVGSLSILLATIDIVDF